MDLRVKGRKETRILYFVPLVFLPLRPLGRFRPFVLSPFVPFVNICFYASYVSLTRMKSSCAFSTFGVTITFFNKEDPGKRVIGFYTLCPACIQQDSLPEKFLIGPKPNPIPGFRICRLAVDKPSQGKGIGQIIFIHA